MFRQIEQSAKQAVVAVKEIDKAIVDLQMATGDSYTNIRQLVSGYNDFAKQLGATTTEVTSGASDWLRQGKSIAETNKLIQDSMVLSKVANIGSEDATSYLTAMMKGYKKSVEEVSDINDSLTSIDLAAAVDAGGLAEATSRVAASADLAGVSLNKLLGYEAAIGEASQESMSVIGNSLKTLFSRMSDIKAGNLELIDEDGTTETLSDVETVLNNVGIQLRDSTNEFRSFDDVLDDTAKKWDNLSSVQQAAVSKAFAGQRQANRFKLLMENYNTALDYEKIADKSSGTAMQKFNDAYLNSIEAKQKSLQSSFEGLSVNLISRDSIGGIMEATQALVEFLDKTNLLKGALAGFATGGLLKGFVTLTASITQAAMKMQNFREAKNLLKAGDIGGTELQRLTVLVDGLSTSQLKAVLSSKELKTAQRLTILSSMGMTDAQAQATLATMGLASAEGAATASTLSLGAAFKGLWSTLKANPIVAISTAISAIIMGWSIYKQSIEESIQKATDATSAWRESNNVLDEQISKYKELKSQLDSGTLTQSEEYEARQQILDIQSQITEQYGQQASGIDLVNGSLQTQLALLQQISAENAKEILNENRKEYKDASKEMAKERKYNLGIATGALSDANNLGRTTEFGEELKKIVDSYENLKLITDGYGTHIEFTGDASQAEEVINRFMNDVKEASELDGGSFAATILDSSSKALSKNQEVLDNYQENYKSFLQMDMLSEGTGKGSVADTFNRYTEAVEKYNNALSSGDTDNINEARSNFAFLNEEVNSLLSIDGNDRFTSLFNDVAEQLNTAGIKVFDFQEALSGKAGDKNQFGKISDDIKSTSDDLKSLKLDAVDAMNTLLTEGEQAGENELWSLAKAWGLSAESSKEEVAEFVDVLSQAGLVSGQVGDSMEIASKSFDVFSSAAQKAITDIGLLKTILSESVSGAGISAENVTAFRDMFGDDAEKALEKTANGYHINKKAMAELQSQMDAMTKTNYLSALSDQYTELQNMEGKIAAAEILGQDTSGLEASRNGILDNISSLQDLQSQYEAATSAYQQWQAAMSGGEEGDMYDSIYGNIEKATELYNKGLTGTNAFHEFADLMSNKDLSSASNEEIIAAYEEAMPKIKRYFTEGQEGAQNFLTDIQNINSEWARMNEDGSWDINFGKGNDQEIADALKIDVEAVQAIMRKLSDYGFEINLDEPVASLEELKSQAESASETLSSLGDDLKIDFEVDTFEGVEDQISSLKEYIGKIENSDLDLDIKTDKLNAANSILEYLVTRKEEIGKNEDIDVSINVDESELQAGYDTLSQLKSSLENMLGSVGLDMSGAQAEIDSCVSQIEAMSPEMKVALGINGMSIEQIKSGLMDGSIKVPVSADTAQANSNVDSVEKKKINDKKFNVIANTTQATSALAYVKSYLSGITSKTVTVTVNKVTNETTNKTTNNSSKKSKSGGQDVQGTAHAQGTAYVGGNWGNPESGEKLVGELGREIIVNPHTGRWYTVGDNGAEFVEVPKDAIVFNHLQSENLLKNGYVTGRGKALVSGTAYSSGSGRFNIGGSGSKSSSASSSKKKKPASSNNSSPPPDNSSSDSAKDFKETIDYIEMAIDRIERQIKNVERIAGSAYNTFAKRNNALKDQLSSINEELDIQQAGYDRYIQEADSISLSEDYKDQVRNGTIDISTITDESLAGNIKDFQQWYEKALDCRDAVEELKESVRDLYKEAFDNVVKLYDGMLGQIEHRQNILEGFIDQTETQGYIVSTKYYDALINNEQGKLEKLNKQRQDSIAAMNDAIINGNIEVNSEQWYEFQEEINKVNEEIQDAQTSLIEFNNSIRELKWDVFDKIQDRISGITDEADFLIKLMSDEDMYDDEGNVTKQGTATYGLHGVNYNVYMSQADQYKKEMESIQEELSKDPHNETLIERRKELLELQQESILAAEEEKEAIKSLVEDGIEKQLDALDKLIDKYLDAIDSEKDMRDYQKKVESQQSEVSSLEKQLSAYAGDDSEEGRAKRQQVQKDLKEARENLEETQYEKAISDQKKLLDDLYSEYEMVLNMRLDNIDQLITSVIDNVNLQADGIRETLETEAGKVGYQLTDSMNTIWGTNGTFANILTTYGNNFTSILTSVQTAINDIKLLIQNAVNQSNATAESNISGANEQQAEQTAPPAAPPAPAPEPPAPSNNGGDGVPRIGDAVTFASGRYYYDSEGANPSGNQMLGQQVYITSINNASWARKQYHISKGSRLGAEDLGWVSLDQLEGYKTGKNYINKDQLAWTQEDGPELVVSRSDGAILTPLKQGDAVINNSETERLLRLANDPTDYFHQNLKKLMPGISTVVNDNSSVQNNINVNIEIDKVTDYNSLVTQLQKDKKVERLIQAVTIDRLAGKNSLAKYNIRMG